MQLEIVHWKAAVKPREGALRRQLEAEGFAVFRWRDDAAAVYQSHAHEHDESLWVVRGEITFGIGTERYALGPGDRLMLPRGTVHTALVGAAGCLYFVGQRR